MPRVDVFFSNDGHHATMFRPMVERLTESDDAPSVRLLSLCEFRGLLTPGDLGETGAVVERVLAFRLRRGSGGPQSGSAVHGRQRRFMRRVIWGALLKHRIESLLRDRPDLVVLPNDAAFPYDRISRMLHRRRIPFVLVQEGIRFPMPNEEGDGYGRSGAAAIAAWGENSSSFFRSQGVSEERIVVTGNPRYDAVTAFDWREEANRLKRSERLESPVLLVLTNPIDAQGFCSPREKVALTARYLRRIEPLIQELNLSVVVKIHGGESRSDYESALEGLASRERLRLMQREALYPLLEAADAAVVMASTVGLEALLFGIPLGVLEIPGHGYVHDYVESGAALPLAWQGDLVDATRRLLQDDHERRRYAAQYVSQNLAHVGSSSERIADLVMQQLGTVSACG